MIKRILVGLAGTPYSPAAIRTAVELALRHGAELPGVTVVDLNRLASVGPVPAGAGHYASRLREHHFTVTGERLQKAVGEFECACRDAGIAHSVRKEIGDAFGTLVAASRYHDLTVFGVRGIFESDLGPDDPGKTLAKILEAGLRPIVAVGREVRPIRRVLVAYSGSLESSKAMRSFVQLRPWEPEVLRIVTFQESKEKGRALLEGAADFCRSHGLGVETEAVAGSPKDHLLSYATGWNVDLIVLGNSAKSLLRRRLFGETALEAMRSAELPLFLSQ